MNETGDIIRKDNNYEVVKDGEKYCTCVTYELAYYMKEKLNEYNFKKGMVNKFKADYPKWYTELMHLYQYVNQRKERGLFSYFIKIPSKYGKTEHDLLYGYTQVEEALFERDYLVANEWDYDQLIYSIDDADNKYYDYAIPPYPERKIRNISSINYHEKELTRMHELIQVEDNPRITYIAKDMNVTPTTIRHWLKKWGSNWYDFLNISKKGVNPLTVLKKVKHYYKPDLSSNPVLNMKNPIKANNSKKYPFKIRFNNTYFGVYSSYELAEKAVGLLDEYGWDKNKLDDVYEQIDHKLYSTKYITCADNGSFMIRKYIDGKLVYFGSYKDYNLACRVRDLLKDNNWDKNRLDEFRSIASTGFIE